MVVTRFKPGLDQGGGQGGQKRARINKLKDGDGDWGGSTAPATLKSSGEDPPSVNGKRSKGKPRVILSLRVPKSLLLNHSRLLSSDLQFQTLPMRHQQTQDRRLGPEGANDEQRSQPLSQGTKPYSCILLPTHCLLHPLPLKPAYRNPELVHQLELPSVVPKRSWRRSAFTRLPSCSPRE